MLRDPDEAALARQLADRWMQEADVFHRHFASMTQEEREAVMDWAVLYRKVIKDLEDAEISRR